MTISDAVFVSLLIVWLLACDWRVHTRAALVDFSREATVPLRGLLVLVVLTGHFLTRLRVVPDFHLQVYAVGVFIFMSGYGAAKSLQSKGCNYLDGYLLRTAQKLLLPLLVVMLTFSLLALRAGHFDFVQIIRGYAQGQTPLCAHSWYIFELFALSGCFYVAAHVRNGMIQFCVLAGCCFALCVVLRMIGWPHWWWISICGYAVGFGFSRVECRVRSILVGNFRWAVPLTLAALMAVLFLWKGNVNLSLPAYLLQLVIGLAVVIGSFICPVPQNLLLLQILGGISFELYLVHGVVRNSMVRHLPQMNLFVEYILILGVSIGAAVVLQYVVKVINSAFKRIHAV